MDAGWRRLFGRLDAGPWYDEPPMTPSRRAGIGRLQGAVALARARLRSSGGGRAARISAVIIFIGFAIAAAVLRSSEGPEAALSSLVGSAARWLGVLAASPVAFATAEDRGARDRADGIDALVASRGVSPGGLESARVVAAMTEIARVIAVPLIALAVLVAAMAGRVSTVLNRLSLVGGALGFAIVTGVALGGLGALVGRASGKRGRTVLFAVLILPWILGELAGHSSWSLPGALGALVDFTFGSGRGAG